MNVNLGIWDKLTKLAIFVLCVLAVALLGLWYLPLIKHNERLRQELLRVENKIQIEEEANRALKTSFDAARTNPKTIERNARAILGYAKPGEVVVRFEDPAPRR